MTPGFKMRKNSLIRSFLNSQKFVFFHVTSKNNKFWAGLDSAQGDSAHLDSARLDSAHLNSAQPASRSSRSS